MRTPETSPDWRPRRHPEQICRDGFFDLKRLCFRLNLLLDRSAINDLKQVEDPVIQALSQKTVAAVSAVSDLLQAYSRLFPEGSREGQWIDRSAVPFQRSWPRDNPDDVIGPTDWHVSPRDRRELRSQNPQSKEKTRTGEGRRS
jgi:hypothetical protein